MPQPQIQTSCDVVLFELPFVDVTSRTHVPGRIRLREADHEKDRAFNLVCTLGVQNMIFDPPSPVVPKGQTEATFKVTLSINYEYSYLPVMAVDHQSGLAVTGVLAVSCNSTGELSCS